MILEKLREAVAEIGVQRTQAIATHEAQLSTWADLEAQLLLMITRLANPEPGTSIHLDGGSGIRQVKLLSARSIGRDKLDDIADIIRAEGKPLHITVIAERLSALKGKRIERTQIEPGLNRHIATVKQRRIDKFGPSVFGLPEWKATGMAYILPAQEP